MATLLENEQLQTTTQDRAAQLHNAGIQERYRRLRDAEERQFAQPTQNASNYTVRASVLAPERPSFAMPVESVPAVEQVPQVTEYVRERIETPVFTTDKFQAVEEQATAFAPAAPMEMPQIMQAPTMTAAVEESYSLSAFAKRAMAIFGAVVTVMLSVIGINSHLINQKNIKIRNLEQKREELMEKNEEIQRRIENATDEQTIMDYILSEGMIPLGE